MKGGFHRTVLLLLLLVLAVPVLYAAQCVDITSGSSTLTSGIVSYWSADNTTADSVGSNDGSIQGNVTYVQHFSNNLSAWYVGGTSSDYILVPHDSSLNPSELTLSLWTYHVGSTLGNDIYDKYNETSSEGYRLDDPLSGRYRWTTDANDLTQTTPKSLVGGWTHVTLTYDSTSGKQMIFYGNPNNAFNVNNTYTGGITASPVNLEIGRGLGGTGGAYIDDVILWNRVLSTTEIEQLYTTASESRICQFVCGDGVIDPDETCDDGNTVPGDGCSATCDWEAGSCGAINTAGTYTLTSNYTVGVDCYNISSSNVILDCSGYTLSKSNAGGTAVRIKSGGNITIQNCNFHDWGEYAVDVQTGGSRITIRNSNVTQNVRTRTAAIYAGNGVNNLTVHNVYADADGDYGIDVADGLYHHYYDNQIEADTAIHLYGTSYSRIHDNDLDGSGATYGIILENDASDNHIYNNSVHDYSGSLEYSIAVLDQLIVDSFHVFVNNGAEYEYLRKIHFPMHPRNKSINVSLPDGLGDYHLRIQQNSTKVDAAHLDGVFLIVNGTPVPPTIATIAQTNQSIVDKVSSIDLDVADVFNKTMDFYWDGLTPGTYELLMHAREEPDGAQRRPLYNPEEFRVADTYLSYTLNESQTPTIDGYYNASEGYGPIDYSVYWYPATGHPPATNVWYATNDESNLYVLFEFTSDNTFDYGKDWSAVYVEVNGTRKEFRVSATNTTYGSMTWSYTPTVTYQHTIFEFSIPMAEIGATPDDEISLAFAAYGTGGGALPSERNNVTSNTISNADSAIYLLNSDDTLVSQNIYISNALDLEFDTVANTRVFNDFATDFDFSAAGLVVGDGLGSLLDYTSTVTASGTNFTDSLRVLEDTVYVNSSISGLNATATLSFANVQYENPVVYRDSNDDGIFEPCGNICSGAILSGTQYNITVQGFSTYKVFNNGTGQPTAITIDEPIDIFVGAPANFTVNYTTLNGTPVPNANVDIAILGLFGPTPMTFNQTGDNLWRSVIVFNTSGNYTWIANATNTANYNNGTVNSTFTVQDTPSGGSAEPVPEFGDVALLLILGLVLGGFVTMRKKL